MNPFDHIKNLHTKQRNWNDFNDEEKKSFNIYIINKALSMNPNYIDIVNMVQKYTNNMLGQKEVFNLYYNLLSQVLKDILNIYQFFYCYCIFSLI